MTVSAAPPLPVTETNLTGNTLASISTVLARHGIVHGPLRDVSAATNLNLHATDGANVFIKTPRGGLGGTAVHREVEPAAWAHSHGVGAVPPLTATPLRTDDGRLFTVFGYGTFVTPGSLLDRANAATRCLNTLHHLATPTGWEAADAHVYARITADRVAGLTGLTAPVAILPRIARRAADEIAARSHGKPVVAVHCDPHLDNLVTRLDGTAAFVDWESAAVGPAEWDIAVLLRGVLARTGPYPEDYRVEVAGRVAAAFADLDGALIDALVRLRACSTASLLHATGRTDCYEFNACQRLATGGLAAFGIQAGRGAGLQPAFRAL